MKKMLTFKSVYLNNDNGGWYQNFRRLFAFRKVWRCSWRTQRVSFESFGDLYSSQNRCWFRRRCRRKMSSELTFFRGENFGSFHGSIFLRPLDQTLQNIRRSNPGLRYFCFWVPPPLLPRPLLLLHSKFHRLCSLDRLHRLLRLHRSVQSWPEDGKIVQLSTIVAVLLARII